MSIYVHNLFTVVGLSWGFITQCLKWAGVISWSWTAIWLPCLLLTILAVVLGLLVSAAQK